MKNHKSTVWFLAVVFSMLVTSCGKDNDTKLTSKTETPIQTTISQKIVLDTSYSLSAGYWESGFKLYFSKNGKITKLGCQLPEEGFYTVSFWDFNNQTLLASTVVYNTDPSNFTYNDIDPIEVTANKVYVLSVNNTSKGIAKKHFVFIKKSNVDMKSIFPFTNGKTTVERMFFKGTSLPSIPLEIYSSQYYITGVADLEFVYEE